MSDLYDPAPYDSALQMRIRQEISPRELAFGSPVCGDGAANSAYDDETLLFDAGPGGPDAYVYRAPVIFRARNVDPRNYEFLSAPQFVFLMSTPIWAFGLVLAMAHL